MKCSQLGWVFVVVGFVVAGFFISKHVLLVLPHQTGTIHPNSLFITILAIGRISNHKVECQENK